MISSSDHGLSLHEQLMQQERRMQFDSFSLRDVWLVGSKLVQLGMGENLPISISAFMGDQRVFHSALEGSTADNDEWLERKLRVVRRFSSSSLAVGEKFRAKGRDFRTDSNLDPARFVAAGGAFPIKVRGSLVGVIGVSGMSEREDHDLVVKVLEIHRISQ